MKIINITSQTIQLPLKTPFITALRRVENVEFVRVKLSCSNGFISYGEAPATMAITGEDLEIITNSIQSIKDNLISHSPKEALQILHDNSIGSSTKAALDIAIISLLAQEKGVSLSMYLGAKQKTPLQTDITISLNTIEKMLHDTEEAISNKMNILKVKLGADIHHAIKITQEISCRFPEAKILVDANQAWNLQKSLLFVEAMKNINIELIEQPVKANMLKELKTITDATNIPILADESAFDLEEVKYIVESKSADMINIKLMKCGGLSKAVKILEYARKNGVVCMLGSMLEGPISINAAVSLAFAYSDVIKYIDLDSPLLYKNPSQELEFRFDGCFLS